MRSFNLKKLAAVSVLGLVAVLGTNELANAQNGNRDYRDYRQDRKQNRKIDKQQQKIQRQRAKIEADRVRLQQHRQAERYRQNNGIRYGNDRSNGNGYYNGNANANTNRNRYRVNRNGRYYNTDQRGADLLRQAVNSGYQQGFQAARNNGRRGVYSRSNVYQNGTYGYQSYVDRGQYQYYFRQGFQRGYQDGSNRQYQDGYEGNYQYGYGSSNGGTLSILSSILGSILNIQNY